MLSDRSERGPALLVALALLSILLPASLPSSSGHPAATEPIETLPRETSITQPAEPSEPAAQMPEEECPNELPVVQGCTEGFLSVVDEFFFDRSPRQPAGPMPSRGGLELASAEFDAQRASVSTDEAVEVLAAAQGKDLKLHRATYRTKQEKCTSLPSLYDSQILISTVVDPVASGLRAQFDRQLDAIMRGIEASGYERSRFWTPWHRQGDAGSRAAFRAADGSTYSCARQLPGIMLFRPSARHPRDPALALFLVGETPTWGVHKRALFTSLNLTASNAPAPTPSSNPLSVRILGPTFSGSAASLQAVLKSWKPRNGQSSLEFEVISGSATSPKNRTYFPAKGEIHFSAATLPADILARVFYRYLQDEKGIRRDEQQIGCHLKHVATLSEGGTAYGASLIPVVVSQQSATGKSVCDCVAPACVPEIEMPFPLHIASVRAKYDEQKRQRAVSPGPIPGLLPATSLDPTLDDTTIRSDTPRPLSAETSVSDDLLLARIITALAERDIRYLGIVATDPADTVFLAGQIRERRPDVRLFTFDSDALYAHPSLAGAMRGMLIVSPYTLQSDDQLWTSPFQETFQFFPSSSAIGFFNAVQLLVGPRGDTSLIEYGPWTRRDSKETVRRPAVWISSVGARGAQAITFNPDYEDFDSYVHTTSADPPDPIAKPKIYAPANWAFFAVVVLAFCTWQLGGFVVALWPPRGRARISTAGWAEGLRVVFWPLPPLSIYEEKEDVRSHLAVSLAVGSILALVMLVILPYFGGVSGCQMTYEPTAMRWLALALAFIAFVSAVVCLFFVQGRATHPTFAERLCTIAALGPPGAVAFVLSGLRSDAAQHEGLFLLRAMSITSRLSPIAPLLFSLGLMYLWCLVNLTRRQVDCAWMWVEPGRSPAEPNPAEPAQARRLAGVLSASVGALSIGVLLSLRPVSTLEGRFGDCVFFATFVAIGAVVISALGLFVALWFHLRRYLKDMCRRFDGARITEAMRRLPDALTAAARPLGLLPEREHQARCFRDLLDWLDRTEPSLTTWASRSAERRWATLEIEKESAIEPDQKRSSDRKTADDTVLEAREVGRRVALILERFWGASPCLWPACAELPKEPERADPRQIEAATAFTWLLKAEELLAACEAMPIYPMVGRLHALLVLAVGGAVLCGLTVASYAFQPERLLNTIFSLILMAILATTLIALVMLERNPVLSALTKTPPKITWSSFLGRAFVYVGLPLLAFLALQYPVAANEVSSWLDPVARLVR